VGIGRGMGMGTRIGGVGGDGGEEGEGGEGGEGIYGELSFMI
jgi:hypothetical protein